MNAYNGSTGALIGQFVAPAQGQIEVRHGMVFNGGYLYVGSGVNNEVLQYNASTGAFVGVFISGVNPTNLAFGPDANGNANTDLYVSTSSGISRYDGTTGAYLGTYITNGSGGLSGAELHDVRFHPDVPLRHVRHQPGPQVQRPDRGVRGRGRRRRRIEPQGREVRPGRAAVRAQRRQPAHPPLHGDRHVRR